MPRTRRRRRGRPRSDGSRPRRPRSTGCLTSGSGSVGESTELAEIRRSAASASEHRPEHPDSESPIAIREPGFPNRARIGKIRKKPPNHAGFSLKSAESPWLDSRAASRRSADDWQGGSSSSRFPPVRAHRNKKESRRIAAPRPRESATSSPWCRLARSDPVAALTPPHPDDSPVSVSRVPRAIIAIAIAGRVRDGQRTDFADTNPRKGRRP